MGVGAMNYEDKWTSAISITYWVGVFLMWAYLIAWAWSSDITPLKDWQLIVSMTFLFGWIVGFAWPLVLTVVIMLWGFF
jgi:hypothetical protein